MSAHTANGATSVDPNAIIWRYFDFTKFVWLLEYAALFFARLDLLGDPFEGSYPKLNEQVRLAMWKEMRLGGHALTDADIAAFEHGRLQQRKTMRERIFVTCWHRNEEESDAMWKAYGPNSIAVRSTYGRLTDVLDSDCFIGAVDYIDYDRDHIWEGSWQLPIFRKRHAFRHEQEIRAGVFSVPIDGDKMRFDLPLINGVSKEVDLAKLIDRILVAPTAPLWLCELVKRLVAARKLDFDVTRSPMANEPNW